MATVVAETSLKIKSFAKIFAIIANNVYLFENPEKKIKKSSVED